MPSRNILTPLMDSGAGDGDGGGVNKRRRRTIANNGNALSCSSSPGRYAHRPETSSHNAAAYYSAEETERYNATNCQKQYDLTQRCLALAGQSTWGNNAGPLILDVGCGSCLGWRTNAQPDSLKYAAWVGFDVSRAMLLSAQKDNACAKGTLVHADAASQLPLRNNVTLDACVSVSAVQWLANGTGACARLCRQTVNRLKPGAALAWQVYPPTDDAAHELAAAPAQAGCVAGGIVGDLPHATGAVKFFVVGLKGEAASTNTDTPPQCVLCHPHLGGCALWWHWRRGDANAPAPGCAPGDNAACPEGVSRLWDWHVREARRHRRLEARAKDEAALLAMKEESRAILLAEVQKARESRARASCPWWSACYDTFAL